MKQPKTNYRSKARRQRELFAAIEKTMAGQDTPFDAYLAGMICDLFERWQQHKSEVDTQKFYIALSSLKQVVTIAKQLGLFTRADDGKENPFEAYLKERGLGRG